MITDTARSQGHYLSLRFFRLMSLCFVLALLAVSCSGGQSDSSESTGQSSSPINDGLLTPNKAGPKPTITIAVTDWTAARANGVIAEKLIERRLGYPVTLVDVLDIDGLLQDLASGEVSAVLELWVSTLEESEVEFINSGRVARLGDLGVTAKVGWFVPRYLVEADPTLATWEGFRNLDVAKQFATDETGESGRFLGTNPDYVTFDEELMTSLDIPFVVEYSGSDETTRRELASATSSQEPILAYWWTPTAEITEFDLVNVALPERDEACVQAFADGQLLRCDYPEEALVKLGSPQLAEQAPDVETFLRNFTLTTEDQLAITHSVESLDKSVDEVTTEWIEDNQDRWETWLAADG